LFFRFSFSSAFAMYLSGLYIHYLVFVTLLSNVVGHLFERVCGFFLRRKPPVLIERKMSWLAACKEYATKHGKWVVPKKDSAEYAEIKKIQARMAGAAAPAAPAAAAPVKEKKPRAPRKPKVAEEVAGEAAVAAMETVKEEKPVKLRAKAPKAAVEPIAAVEAAPTARRGRKAAAPAAVNDNTAKTVVFA